MRSLLTLLFVLGLTVAAGIGTAVAAPPAPAAVAPVNGASVLVPFTISWSAVTDPSGIAGYNWQISSSSTFSPLVRQDSTNGQTTQATVSGLPGGTYLWRVQAVSGAFEQGPWSQPQTFTVTGAGSGTPGTPGLDPTVGYSTFHPWEFIRFTWSAVPEAATYFFMFSNDPDFPVGATPPGVTTSWSDNIPTNSTGYVHALDEGTWYARVYAVSAAGIFSLPSNVISYTVFYNNPVPAPPVLISPINNPTLTLPITLRWAHVVNPQASGYEVQISSSSSFSNNEAPLGVQLTAPEFNILSLTSGTKFWRVRSHQGMSSPTTTAPTAWSATGTFTLSTAPSTPVSITPFRIPLYSGDDTWVAVQLTAGVPAAGATIALASSNAAAAPVPPTIPMQGTHAWTQFQMVAGQVTAPTPVTLTATLNGASASGQFTVNPPSLRSLTLTPVTISGGASAGGTLMLNGQAPAGGAVVSLSSNSSAANPPSTVTIPAGSYSASFSVPTSNVTANTPATITASWGGVTVQSQITVAPGPAPTSLTLFPATTVGGGGSVDGTVTIASAATFDQFLQVTSNNPAVLPFLSTSVMVPAGSTRGFIMILPAAVSATTLIRISVTGGGVTRFADLTVNPSGTPPPPATLSSFSVSPTSVAGGNPAVGTVTLPSAAPSGGTVVTLGSNQPGAASVPPTVTVAAGATSANFTVTTFPNAGTTVQLSATLGDSILFAAIGVNPAAPTAALSAVTVTPTTVVGGASSTGTVTLSAGAPSGGAVVSLSDNSTAATTPASVTVPAGGTSANFTITTTSVTASTSVPISAVFNGVTRTVTLTVSPPAPAAPSLLSPANGATPAQPLTLDWTDVAAAATYQIQIDDSSTFSAPRVVDQTLTVSQFSVASLANSQHWWRVRGVSSAGTAGAWSAVRSFTPQASPPAPPALSAIAVSPASVGGGTAAQGTVTLTAAAPAGGFAVALSSDAGAAAAPGSVTVAQGATSATFAITTSQVATSTPATITASAAGVTRTATLTVTPPGQALTLTVTATGRSGERITSSPAGINVAVGSTGSASFTGGTAITLTVSNGRDAIWSGACSSGGNKAKTCRFTPTANASVTANVQ